MFLLASPLARAQSWATIPISFYPGTMLLMTDGTVLVHYVSEQPDGTLYSSGVWMRLTPDAFGNYTDGTWSQLPTMPSPYAPRFHATAVLPDGRVLVEGGEYNTDLTQVETTMGAIYDPVSNARTRPAAAITRTLATPKASSCRTAPLCSATAAAPSKRSSTQATLLGRPSEANPPQMLRKAGYFCRTARS